MSDEALANEPLPLVDHMPDAECVELAEIDTAPLPLHVEYGPPALAVGVAWIVSVAIETAGLAHGETGLAVHVNVRVPAVTSAALGVYVVLASIALPNVPVPFVLHMPDDECVDVAEIRTGLVPHVEYGPPALDVGVPWIVKFAFDAAVPVQGEIAIAVQVRITLPAMLSAALGVYVVESDVAFANEPEPLVVHMPDEKFVDVAEIATGPLPTHVEYGPPAKLVSVPWIVSVAFDTAGLAHGAVGFAVHVNVTLPADWKEGTRLPGMFWFYPYEYTDSLGYLRTLESDACAAARARAPTY